MTPRLEASNVPEPISGRDRAAARRVSRITPVSARGEPYVWLAGAGLAAATLMTLGLLGLVLAQGLPTFWPGPLVETVLTDGRRILGEEVRRERYRPDGAELTQVPDRERARIAAGGGWSRRRLLRTGNYDLYGEDFTWVADHQILEESRPAGAWMLERLEWGPAIGYPLLLTRDDVTVAEGPEEIAERFGRLHEEARADLRRIHSLEKGPLAEVNDRMERSRLATRGAAIQYGEESRAHQEAATGAAREEVKLMAEHRRLSQQSEELRAKSDRYRLRIVEAGGRLIPEGVASPESPLRLSQVVRAYPANALSLSQRVKVYLDRWREYLTSEPREANTEGGVLPAIFGTFMMTVMMSLAVGPLGVIAALYLREYARQGLLVSSVRIAVNNLAGVPSIVFGVFGLGFFCYFLGGSIDALFFPEKLPAPTYGTGGILWASLTLAMLTVPVVIVATEEALAAVPRSMREGSFACGASKWQTIRRIVLPRAAPGILTGLILAMARGAGEVAPLMLTGVVKLAPELPFDSHAPFFHLERSFMHLGFHIYDVGFQSRNSEAGKPMVFTTTLLLIALVALLNLTAISLRGRLMRRYRTGQF